MTTAIEEDRIREENAKECKKEFYSALTKGFLLGSGGSAAANLMLHNTSPAWRAMNVSIKTYTIVGAGMFLGFFMAERQEIECVRQNYTKIKHNDKI